MHSPNESSLLKASSKPQEEGSFVPREASFAGLLAGLGRPLPMGQWLEGEDNIHTPRGTNPDPNCSCNFNI